MEYQALYEKYQAAVKLRELDNDENFKMLKDIFVKRILSNISFTAQNNIITFLAGIREVFSYVESEASKVSHYRDELDMLFSERNK